MKTKEELSALREEVEALNKKLADLPEEELAFVAGGDNVDPSVSIPPVDPGKLIPPIYVAPTHCYD